MAASSQVSQNKRGRDEDWNGELSLADAKRTNRELTMAHDSHLMALLEKIDNMDANNSNPEETDIAFNKVINSVEDDTGSKGQKYHNVESTDEMDGIADQMGSNKKGESTPGIGDFSYYDDVRAEFDFFVDNFTPEELRIIMSHMDGDSIPDIMYLDAAHNYAETGEVFYGPLWDDDIWQLNEDPVIQNDLASPQQEEFGINGSEFHDVGATEKQL